MTAPVLPAVLFVALLGMVITWFVLIRKLYARLERAHPGKYEAMGRPSLVLRNNIATNWATLKFLVGREHRALGDSGLSKLSDAMLGFFAIYLVVFFWLVFFLVGQASAA
ncbi:hypothetical protein BGP89_09065 [Luteimonas sp. JM171]|uniref:hypothetical protein n=1 Tax=Luteimonas sp. JM171 TaxID=1896164 RepID=UPI000858584D|nr:hypothetical protein [Luteimonas sp. JM171]AOH36488.1 hypothetical protein BGP89_09065 [Luteimonas sp. JM171]